MRNETANPFRNIGGKLWTKERNKSRLKKRKKLSNYQDPSFYNGEYLDNDFPKNHQIILPGTFQSTGGTFGGLGYNVINNPYCGQTENPDKNDDYIYY